MAYQPTIAHRTQIEYQYLNLIKHILLNGEHRVDRTGTGTLSVFAPPQLRFSLKNGLFPLVTTKRVFFRGVVEELLWFIRGGTNSKELSEKGVNIWEKNGSREYLDRLGLEDREEGDLGPIYGFQWRHFGATYTNWQAEYGGQGIDQLSQVISRIKRDPTDRRIILTAWNPSDIPKMSLPPCHMFCQFYVSTATPQDPVPYLSCQMYQRSCDMGLGVPFNIASYALLTYMVAHVTGLQPGSLIHCMGDAHVYEDHIDALAIQVKRTPRPFPSLQLNPSVKSIEDFRFEDFILKNYSPHSKISMNMSA
ncbi:thymidylate synthase [Basidiobolus meristosporus CBS 931.73]|uniref:thymidylate synthase n=1 Tax=Basidiobolus meristosporus CBS 931.73 TaxID=1314790 RepID=A0A1Y1XLM8_9FUNG|nr:thymidylate synthase [Basidiobolus meristosporus CBS 931.73]|eukprot:ORX86642.1 thymidylate synthase [Basidiobolus meristosporus CBS 931.73]